MHTNASPQPPDITRQQAAPWDAVAVQPEAGGDQAPEFGKRIDALVDTSWAFSALCAAVELGLLTDLASPRTAAELASRSGLAKGLTGALLDVLVASGFAGRDGPAYAGVPEVSAFFTASTREDVLARLRSAHLQSRAMVDAARQGMLRPGWVHTDPELLQAQGRSGRATTHAMARAFRYLPGLEERLLSPGGRFLDVGMGVGIISIEMCRLFPHLRVVGLEPGPVQAQEARRNIDEAGLVDRIEIRTQRLEDFNDQQEYDLAYLAQPFMPLEVVKPGLVTIRNALRPGGYVSMAAFDAPGDDVHAATARLLNALWGGTQVDLNALLELTRDAGFEMVNAGGEPGSLVKGIIGRRPQNS